MEKRKSFALGMLIGVIVMVLLNLGLAPLRTHRVWGSPLSPEAKIMEIYSILEAHSIIPVERNVLIDNMFRGMLEGVGDPYTYYFNREALALFLERNAGTYAGIGMLVTIDPADSRVTVVNVFEGSPAYEAGLLPGDKIMQVDGDCVADKRLEEVTALVKGPPGTQVRLVMLRGEENFNIMITRQQINVPTTSHRMLEEGVGVLRIDSFEGVTYNQFVAAYLDLRNQDLRGLIIDLRNNPGGSLDSVVDISNLLLPSGSILYVENKQGERRVYASDNDRRIDVPLVVLVNGGSASASEVLTGAVRDHGVATIVGEQTFGKGVVQAIHPLRDGSAVKITIAKYYTPNNISIHGEGITPDYVVEVDRMTSFMAARLSFDEDVQMQKAFEIMLGKLAE